MEVISIQSEPKTQAGKKIAKQIRRDGLIPCVLYGIEKNLHFSVKPAEVKDLIYTPDFKVAQINIDGKEYRCFVKDIQLHPVTDQINHIDFYILEEGKKVKIEIPVHFHGVSPGVKNGGTLVQKMRKLRVSVLPENMITEVNLDISKVELGDTIRIKDIPVMKGIEILYGAGVPVASVAVPRALKSAQAEEEEAAAAAALAAEEAEGEEGSEEGTETTASPEAGS
jgi:large subunit ribosomal protein L25